MRFKRFIIPALSLGTALCISVGVLGVSRPELVERAKAQSASASGVQLLSADVGETAGAGAEYPAGVSSEKDFSYAKAGYRNAYEKLIAEDGFMYGMDLDWVKHNMDFAWSLGDNELLNHAAAYSENSVAVDLYNIKALGFNAVNMWLFNGLAGMQFDHNTGYVTGLSDTFRKNLVSFLNLARKYDLKVVLSLQPHTGFNYGNRRDGLSEQDIRNRYLQFYYKDEAREAYMDNLIKPVCNDIIKYYQDVVIICDLTVENGVSEVNDDELGMYCDDTHGTTWENFGKFFCAMRDCVREAMPNMMISTEDMFYQYTAYKYNDFDVDLHGFNWYSDSAYLPETADLYSNTPLYMGEINVSENETNKYSPEYWEKCQMEYYRKAWKQGYVGAFYFSWWAGAGNFVMFDESTLKYESMRNVGQFFLYQFTDMKNEYRGIKNAVDKPVLLANRGGSDVYWFPGRGMTRFDLERSDDGGKTWKTVAANLSEESKQGDFQSLKNGLLKYTDNTVGVGMNYQYRVKAYNDETGVSSLSAPNNRREFFVPENMIVNGSFEGIEKYSDIPQKDYTKTSEVYKAAVAGSGWFRNARTVGVITSTDDAYDGSKVLEIDTKNGKGESGWSKLEQKVKLTPGATYELSMWYKSVETDKNISLTARTVNDEYIDGAFVSTPDEPDGEWHKATQLFTAPADGECIVGVWNCDWGYQKGFIDKVELYEVR